VVVKGRMAVPILFLILALAFLGYWHHSLLNEPNGSPSNAKCPFWVPVKEADGSVFAKFNDTIIMRSADGNFFIKTNRTAYRITSSEAYFFPWGFVGLYERNETVELPLILVDVTYYPVVALELKNKTATLQVKHFVACDYRGNLLWDHAQMLPYIWEVRKVARSEEGISWPQIFVSSTRGHFFIAEFHGGLPADKMPDARYKLGNDWLYVYGKEGLVKKIDLGRGYWATRNIFLASNGSYTILGFECPQSDGSPMFGRVIIFENTKPIFDKKFDYDPNCLCHVIAGWGKIREDGCATFGLYTGIGTYCNGTFHYESTKGTSQSG